MIKTILIIDDEIQIRRLLEITLSSNGYKVLSAVNGKNGLIEAASNIPNLIILDLGLPDMDGQDVLIKLREWYSKPIIILSVKKTEDEIIKALDNGANDFLTKPFRNGELLARIRAVGRVFDDQIDTSIYEYGGLKVDFSNYSVVNNQIPVKLTVTEFSLLAILIKNRGRILTHQYILKEVWGFNYIEHTQYLRVYIAQLRKKLELDSSKPTLIITESGIGYRFMD
jgi:two-component system, OmpR family, KDP operon response regulator KdpE